VQKLSKYEGCDSKYFDGGIVILVCEFVIASLSFLVDGTMNDVDSGLGGLHLRRDGLAWLGSCS